MGEKVTFDSTIKTIIITEAPVFDGTDWVVDLDIKVDVFSDGKEDWLVDPLLGKFKFPVTTAGGDDISDDQKLGSTFFLEYGWKIRPYEADHVLRVNGNIYTRDGSSPFAQTVSSHNVMVINTVSNLLDSTIQQLSEIEFSTFQNAVWVKVGSGNHQGDFSLVGNREYPVETISDAVMIANGRGLGRIGLLSSYVLALGEDISGFEVFGENPLKTLLFLGTDAIVGNGTVIKNCFVGGTVDNEIIVRECIVSGLNWISGYLYDSVIFGGIIDILSGATAYIYDCKAGAYGTGLPTFDLRGSGQALVVQGYGGRLKIQNKSGPETISFNAGDGANLIIADNVTNGTIYNRGSSFLSDESGNFIPSGDWNGTIIENEANDPNNITHTLLNYDMTGYDTHKTFGGIQVKDSYNGVIELNADEGYTGVTFPTGLPQRPVNNWDDCKELLEQYHCSRIKVNGDFTVPADANLNGYTFCSGATIDRTMNIPDTARTNGVRFKNLIITGDLDGRTEFNFCTLDDVSGFRGTITESVISGTLDFDDSTGQTSVIANCSAGGDGVLPTFNINGSKISIIEWVGWVVLANKTGSSVLGISTPAGIFTVQDTCTSGIITFSGIGNVNIDDGVGSIISSRYLISNQSITDFVWDDPDAVNLIGNVDLITQIETGKWHVINNQMIFYEDDNTTEIMRFNLFDANSNPSNENVFRREKIQ